MQKGRVILSSDQFQLTITRLCHQLIENYDSFENCCIVGIQDRGAILSDRIIKNLKKLMPKSDIDYGKLDITFYRDDFRRRDTPLKASSTHMDFIIEEKNVILVDDVLYTGRTIQAALTALQQFGRPKKVDLLCLVDRRFNRALPIQSNYVGVTVDSIDEAYVKVEWKHMEGEDKILLYSQQEDLK